MSEALRRGFERNIEKKGRPMTLRRGSAIYSTRGYARRATDDDLTGSAQQFETVIVVWLRGLETLGKLGKDQSARIQRPDSFEYDGRIQTVEQSSPIKSGDIHIGWRCGVKG